MEQSDEDLMNACLAGNQEAIEVIFHRYKRPVFNFALRMLTNRADAEDVTSDVFLVLFNKSYQPHPNTKFSTWLFTVTRNRCIDKLRKRKRMFSMWFKTNNEDGYEQWDVEDKEAIPSEKAEDHEMAVLVRKAIKSLPEQQREAVILREYQKLNYEEIAKILNCSLSNVKILIFRGREAIREYMESFRKEDQL